MTWYMPPTTKIVRFIGCSERRSCLVGLCNGLKWLGIDYRWPSVCLFLALSVVSCERIVLCRTPPSMRMLEQHRFERF